MVRDSNWRWLRPALLCLASGLAVVGMWWAFVLTAHGQQLDMLGYNGAHLGSWLVADRAEALLNHVSVGMVGLAMVLAAVTALLRRRWLLALEAITVVAAANLTTRVLKYHLFHRPNLGISPWFENNSLPSGHTTAVSSAVVAAVLVAPHRLRTVAAMLGSLAMVLFGYATLAAHWHRASDVVSGYLVCFCWAYLALAVAAARQRILGRGRAELPDMRRPARRWPALLVAAGCLALAVAAVCGWLSWPVRDPYSATRRQLFIAYLGSSAGLSGVAVAGMGVLLRLVQLHDAGSDRLRPAPR